jgi:hypothetical protein
MELSTNNLLIITVDLRIRSSHTSSQIGATKTPKTKGCRFDPRTLGCYYKGKRHCQAK